MGKLIFELSDEERDALERVRVKLGLRSHAETLRAMIGEFDRKPAAAVLVKAAPKAWRAHPKPGAKKR